MFMKSPKVIVDANLSKRYAKALKEMGIEVIYVNNNDYGLRPDSSDEEIKKLGYQIGAHIATQNVKHFRDYDNLIPLKSKRGTNYLIEKTVKYLMS